VAGDAGRLKRSMNEPAPRYKIPRSALVVIHAPDLQVLMMERASWPGFWQSVTGGLAREDESFRDAAIREVREETGLDAARYELVDWGIEREFEIFARYRGRYAPGVTRNLEHVFSLEVPAALEVRLDPAEHVRYQWLPYRDAAALTISWSNRDAILALPERRAQASGKP
jgi:dihydroneopterin triphosphate diphosphatase